MMASLAGADGFVGRGRELTALERGLDALVAGRGGMAMLVGEAGIGKTRIAQELARRAAARGAEVLWGRCYEGDWAPPFGPWVEALGDYTHVHPAEELRTLAGPRASVLAGLLPELRDFSADAGAAAALSAEEERVRLYDAVVQFLLAVARTQPLMLVLDDLHWADRASLGLLRHLAHFLPRAALLVVCTYRDVELDRAHPLAALLPVLRHETDYERIALHGLDESETAAYLAYVGRRELAVPLARTIRAETAGNPFYLGQVLRHLLEEGKLVERDGRWTAAPDADPWGVPAGVREVIGRRLARLRAESRRLLELGAAFTGGFDFAVLRTLSGLDESTVLDCIDEALESRLIASIRAVPARYDFVHALVRHTLYEPLNPDRRARLHRRIAEALEALYGERGREHAAELAYQYHASAALPGAETGIPHCLAAAEQALAAYAHAQAATFLTMACDLTDGRPASERAGILSRLAVVQAEALLLAESAATAEDALKALAQAGAPPEALAGFVIAVVRALKDGGAHHTVWEPLLAHGLAAVGEDQGLLWARLTLLKDPVETLAVGTVNASRWLGFDPRAVAILRAEGTEADYARTIEPFGGRSRAETEETLALAQRWTDPAAVMHALGVGARELLYRHGAPLEALARLRELLARAERHGSLPLQAEALVHMGHAFLGTGDLPATREVEERAHSLVDRLGSLHRLRGVVNGIDILLAYFRGGDWPLLAERMGQSHLTPDTSRNPLGITGSAYLALAEVLAGSAEAAHGRIAALLPLLRKAGGTTWTYNGAIIQIAAAVWELHDVRLAPEVRALAQDVIDDRVRDFPFLPNQLGLARMAALDGDTAEALAAFAEARAAADRLGHRPQRAIVDFDEALTLVRAGSPDHARITALFDGAFAAFRTLEMAPWVVRAERRQESLIEPRRSRAAAAYSDGLTPREVEVLRLIAAGRTNGEIAETLVLSVRTVGRHITNLYGKIGARGKADATAYALAHRLIEPASA